MDARQAQDCYNMGFSHTGKSSIRSCQILGVLRGVLDGSNALETSVKKLSKAYLLN